MKTNFLKIALSAIFIIGFTSVSKAQIKLGDNLGNHIAAKDLNMNTKALLNASGVVIGKATVTNESIALEVEGAGKAIMITRVAANTDIANPLPGMIVFNTTDNAFYVRNNTAWVSYSLAITEANGVNTASDVRGYTLTNVGVNTVLTLSPADATNPGIVTVSDQTFAGNKTFNGNVAVNGTSTLTVGTGATTLGGTLSATGAATLGSTLDVAGNVTIGTTAAPATTALNGNLIVVGGTTTLVGGITTGGVTTPGVIIPNVPAAAGVDTENFVVLDADGNLKKSSLTADAFGKNIVAMGIPVTAFSADNQVGKFVLAVTGVKQNDGIIANFDSVTSIDLAEYLTITNAAATADNQVTVWVADLRQPTETDNTNNAYEYTAPVLTGKNFVITRYR